MVLKFFLPEREFSWQQLDKITAKGEGLWTWPMAGLLWLQNNGFEIKDIEVFDYGRFACEGGKYLVDFFGKEVGEAQIEHSDLDQEIAYAKAFIRKITPIVRIPTIHDICQLLKGEYLLVCNVNSNTLNDKAGYVGHFVVVKGFDDSAITLHDPGLPPRENKRVDFTKFRWSWAYPNENAKNIMALRLRQAEREGST
jgi:hypothetical protein